MISDQMAGGGQHPNRERNSEPNICDTITANDRNRSPAVMGTARMAPGMPHSAYQRASARSTCSEVERIRQATRSRWGREDARTPKNRVEGSICTPSASQIMIVWERIQRTVTGCSSIELPNTSGSRKLPTTMCTAVGPANAATLAVTDRSGSCAWRANSNAGAIKGRI